MAAKPDTNMIHVSGSGTTPGAPQGPPFFLGMLTSPAQQPASTLPFFLTGPQSEDSSGGGAMGIQLPPTNGSYKASGPAGNRPGAAGCCNRADWKGAGGDC